jgi:hypothetical protein
MTESEFVREWTSEEAAEKGVRDQSVTPRGNMTVAGEETGADHRSGMMPAADDEHPDLPADPPRGPAGEPGVTR